MYDHKNRKCQWLSFDRNSPGVQSQQNMNYQLYEKKGALNFHVFAHPADTYTTSVSDSQKKHILEVAFLSIDTTASVEVLLIYIF